MLWKVTWVTANPDKKIVETRNIDSMNELLSLIEEVKGQLGCTSEDAVIVVYPKYHAIIISDPCNI